VRRRGSQAYEEILPAMYAQQIEEANAAAERARAQDRAERERRKAEREALPVRRADARAAFARMHAVVDGAGEA